MLEYSDYRDVTLAAGEARDRGMDKADAKKVTGIDTTQRVAMKVTR